jgi:integron integrase
MVDGGAGRGALVRVRVGPRRLELTFGRGFTADDVALVKSIPGRRWHPDDLVWTLPNTHASMAALTRALGPRLLVTREPVGDPAPRERAPAAPGSDPASSRAPASVEPLPPRDPRPFDVEAFLDVLRTAVRTREYSEKTERAYVGWARRFLRSPAAQGRRPEHLNGAHALRFLEQLATEERLAAGSRNQAASALAFMFREVLGRDELADVPRARGPRRVPLVLTHREVLRLLRELHGKYFLAAVLMYSAGLRLEECLRLRVKDVDFELRQILVRDGKGRKDRYVPLARRAVDLLRAQIARVAEQHQEDRAGDHGWAPLPGALHRKDPGAGYDLGWQHVFPATTLTEDPATGRTGRWPLHPTAVQREVKAAVRRSGIPKRATCHTFRHSFATETLRGGCDIRTLQHVMGHKDIRTTMIYLHVVEQTGLYIRSPLDRPDDPDDYDTDAAGRPRDGAEGAWVLASRPRRPPAASPSMRPDPSRGEDPPTTRNYPASRPPTLPGFIQRPSTTNDH